MGWWVPIAVALITGPLVAVINKLRRENTEQHAESRHLLEHVAIKIDKVHDKLVTHIEQDHKEGK